MSYTPPLENTAAEVVAHFLIAKGVGESGAWQIKVGELPPNADKVIAVFDTAGKKDGRYMKCGHTVWHPGLSFLARSLDYNATIRKLAEVSALLDSVQREEVAIEPNAYLLEAVSQTTSITKTDRDDRGRDTLSLNAMCTYSQL